MHHFFDLVVRPAFAATDARRVVEIGALQGATTTRLLEALGPDAELHVIDPLPRFDPTAHERELPGRYVFHRDLSLRALPSIGPADVALIDGDHNWYTVYHELEQLTATARDAGRPMPVTILHDVGWPYGRRDLYYAPETIPAEFRHRHAKRGLVRSRSAARLSGGLNSTLENALEEGGPRNGVLTALEDFVAEHDQPVTTVILPVYFGLGVVAETARIEREPKLAAFFEWLRGPELQARMLALADDLWLGTLESSAGRTALLQRRAAAGAERSLALLGAALLDEHYVDNELRVQYLDTCARTGRDPDPAVLREPSRTMPRDVERLRAQRRRGRTDGDGNDARVHFPYTTMGRVRLDHLARALDAVRTEGVSGDLVECGTGRGGGAIFLRGYVEAWELRDRQVWVADPFRAMPRGRGARRYHPMTADLEAVREGFARFGLLDDRVRFLSGALPDAVGDAPIEAIALLRLGDGLEGSPADVLGALYERVAIGGWVIVEDAGRAADRAAVEAFRERCGIEEPLEQVDAGAVAWRKLAHVEVGEAPAGGDRRAPLAPPLPGDPVELSVVIVVYDMRREVERSLRSLTRAYQEGVDALDYEVVVVDNGSAPGQALDEAYVRSFGPEFRLLDMGDEAHPSPCRALNRGIAAARGRQLALMIDGAHVLTPGVLRHGMLGLATYAPAVVTTQQWHVGPRHQAVAIVDGYDQDQEDRLFAQIGWPSRGYELFEIGQMIGDRDWFDPQAESNCLFVPRTLLERAGGLDESFDAPGGAFANLELLERLAMTPGVTLATVLGEGSFHQLHGGTTTNAPTNIELRRRVEAYRAQYEEIRVKRFNSPSKPMHYVGSLGRETIRSKARWRPRRRLGEGAAPAEPPVLMGAELQEQYVDAYWRSLAWTETSWRGLAVRRAPADLLAYQELVHRLAPRWIVLVGAEEGDGLAPVLAAMLGEGGVVLAVGETGADADPTAAGVRRVAGGCADAETVAEVARTVGDDGALVILARAPQAEVLARFGHFAPLVPVGGTVVVEDTIVNGHPVLGAYGPGPWEAVNAILRRDLRFEPDRTLERFGPTFNPGGYLRRAAP